VLRLLFAYPLNWGAWLLKIVVLPFSPFFVVPLFVVVFGLSAAIVAFLGSMQTRHAFVSIVFAASRRPDPMPLDQALQGIGFAVGPQAMIVVAALAASHLASFLWNYVIRGECNRIGLVALLVVPVARLWLLSTVMTFALVGADRLAAPVWLLLGLVAVKIAFGLFAHLQEHRIRPAPVALTQGT
jgi:hypothetical protein